MRKHSDFLSTHKLLRKILIFFLQMLNSQCRAGVRSEMFHQGRLAREETENGKDESIISQWEGLDYSLSSEETENGKDTIIISQKQCI